MAVDWAPVLVAGLILLALALFLAWRGFRNFGSWMAVLLMLGFADVTILAGYFGDYLFTPVFRPARWFIRSVALAAEIGLVATWPSFSVVGWRRALVVGGSLVPALALVPVAGAIYGFDIAVTTSMIAHASNFTQPLLLVIVATQYLPLRAGPLRSQFFFLLLFLVTWLGFSGVRLVAGGGDVLCVDASDPLCASAGTLQLAALAVVLGAIVLNARRNWEFRSRPQDVVLVSWTLGVVLFALVPAAGDARTFFLMSALSMCVLFFAVARYQVFGVDFRLPTPAGRSLRAAIGIIVFFVVAQVVESEAARVMGGGAFVVGMFVGAVVSGVLLFGLSRVQVLLTAGELRPGPEATQSEYDSFRRIDLYRSALDAIYADGLKHTKEERLLERLRDRLGISSQEHSTLEQQVREERATRIVSLA